MYGVRLLYIYIQIEGFEAFNWGASATFGCRLSGLTIYRSIVVLALPLVLLERLYTGLAGSWVFEFVVAGLWNAFRVYAFFLVFSDFW